MKNLLERIARLIDVKSLVTLALTAVFAILALKSIISGEQFLTIFTVIISFYFGTQVNKKGSDNDESKSE